MVSVRTGAQWRFDRLADDLERRRLDGSGRWRHEASSHAAALVQGGRLGAGPTAFSPLVEGSLAAVGDLRLDNLETLAAQLGVSARAGDPLAILLEAWRRWGPGLADRLEGEFALAIWDGEQQRLFCARDPFGVKPFYFFDQEHFAFASSQGALIAAGCPTEIDEARVADFLVGLPFPQDRTIYSKLRRLPPGSVLDLVDGKVSIKPYFTLRPGRPIARRDAPQAFAELFEDAVSRRMAEPVAVMLSGGLDSSSIAVTAAKLCTERGVAAPRSLSMVFDGASDVDERRHVEAVLACARLEPCWLPSSQIAPTDGLETRLAEQGGPYQAPTHHLSRRLYDAARATGARVVLDGHGGDETVSFGYGRLNELARAGRWISLWRQAQGVAQTFQRPPSALFWAYAGAYGPGRRLARLNARRLRSGPVDGTAWRKMVDPGLAARTNLVDRWRAHVASGPSAAHDEADLHYRCLIQANHSAAFEVLDQAAAAAGVEPRYPFWDQRLIAFCMSLESHEKLAGGYARRIVRQAMAPVLADSVRLRRDKIDFKPQVARGLVARPQAVSAAVDQNVELLAPYVNLDAARQAWTRVQAAPATADGDDVLAVWRAAMLGVWLNKLEHAGDDRAAPEAAGASLSLSEIHS